MLIARTTNGTIIQRIINIFPVVYRRWSCHESNNVSWMFDILIDQHVMWSTDITVE
jgi:hypothetical protein